MSVGLDPGEIAVGADADPVRSELRRVLGGLVPVWHADALCKEFDSDLWFPKLGQSNQPALEICGRCPVRVQCLDEAIDDRALDYGLRGGMTANARKAHRRRQKGTQP